MAPTPARRPDVAFLGRGGALDPDAAHAAFGHYTDADSNKPVDVMPNNFVGPLQKDQNRVSEIRVDAPTTLNHGLGPVNVYPDNFAGSLPPGAMRVGDYKKRVEVYSEISHGTSKVSINTDNFMVDGDPEIARVLGKPGKPFDPKSKEYAEATKRADAFKGGMMGHIGELLKTDLGLEFLEKMGSAKHSTRIEHTPGLMNETECMFDKSSDAVIYMNPRLTTFADPGEKEQPWMTERTKYGLYHEMVHAYHAVNGDAAAGKHKDIKEREFQAVGLGRHDKERYSENAFRAAMGKPLRPSYAGVTY